MRPAVQTKVFQHRSMDLAAVGIKPKFIVSGMSLVFGKESLWNGDKWRWIQTYQTCYTFLGYEHPINPSYFDVIMTPDPADGRPLPRGCCGMLMGK